MKYEEVFRGLFFELDYVLVMINETVICGFCTFAHLVNKEFFHSILF